MKSAVINFSGHALCAETDQILQNRYDILVNTAPYDFDFEAAVEIQLEEMLKDVNCPLNGTVSLTIIPPGQSTLAVLLVSYLHGLTGHFPKMCYLEMSEDGLYIPKVEYDINVQDIRSAGRKYRRVLYSA